MNVRMNELSKILLSSLVVYTEYIYIQYHWLGEGAKQPGFVYKQMRPFTLFDFSLRIKNDHNLLSGHRSHKSYWLSQKKKKAYDFI